jgi:thiol-disulfide isomerase/thioredoxin
MNISARSLFFTLALVAAPVALHAQASEASITRQMQGLRAMPDATRIPAIMQLAKDIRTLPPGLPKVRLANGLSGLTTEIDAGLPVLNAVGDTLAQALTETPVPSKTPDGPPSSAYMELAKLKRYMHTTATVDSPMMVKAESILSANEEDARKADFTLKDLHGKKVTLSELKGKVVLVNFWATWCPPCRKEMPDLDAIYTHFKDQLVILSITDEDMFKVGTFINQANYHPPVLLDSERKVAKMYHVDGIPKSFVYDRDGKLVDESIDELTQKQFLMMLAKAGLHA